MIPSANFNFYYFIMDQAIPKTLVNVPLNIYPEEVISKMPQTFDTMWILKYLLFIKKKHDAYVFNYYTYYNIPYVGYVFNSTGKYTPYIDHINSRESSRQKLEKDLNDFFARVTLLELQLATLITEPLLKESILVPESNDIDKYVANKMLILEELCNFKGLILILKLKIFYDIRKIEIMTEKMIQESIDKNGYLCNLIDNDIDFEKLAIYALKY